MTNQSYFPNSYETVIKIFFNLRVRKAYGSVKDLTLKYERDDPSFLVPVNGCSDLISVLNETKGISVSSLFSNPSFLLSPGCYITNTILVMTFVCCFAVYN